MKNFYRKESLKSNKHKLYGDVLIINPISFWIFTISILVVALVIAIFLYYGTFTRKESVSGLLVPDKGVIKVYAPFKGVIDNLNVNNGQHVKKGEDLINISTQQDSYNNVSANQRLTIQLKSRQDNLNEIYKNEIHMLDNELNRLMSSYQNIELELSQLSKEVLVLENQLDRAYQQWQKYLQFQQKTVITEMQVFSKEGSYIKAKSNLYRMKRLYINRNSAKINFEKQIENIPVLKNKLLQELYSEISILEERLIELEGSGSYSIKASSDGVVTSLNVHLGQNVSLNSFLFIIIPVDSKLKVELYLSSRAIGFVRKGQIVKLRFDAFPYQKFGLYEGTIDEVAKAVINPKELDLSIGSTEPVYRVIVSLNSQFINGFGNQIVLQSGMSLVADIILEKRSLGEWLFAPVYGLKKTI